MTAQSLWGISAFPMGLLRILVLISNGNSTSHDSRLICKAFALSGDERDTKCGLLWRFDSGDGVCQGENGDALVIVYEPIICQEMVNLPRVLRSCSQRQGE